MLKRIFAVVVGKIIFLLSRHFKQGGGTAAPGLAALKIDKKIIEYFSAQCKKGSIVITGTNGKTTTSRLISHYFSQNKISFIHNRAGSNLERGVASAGLSESNWLGQINTDYGLWELDEAAFSTILNRIHPSYIILLNLFRDQLDRYGEVDATKQKWLSALRNSTYKTKVIYNSDDPQLVDLVIQLQKEKSNLIFYGLGVDLCENESENDIFSPVGMALCPRCKVQMNLRSTITGLGKFNCPACGFHNNDAKTKVVTYDQINSKTVGQLSIDNKTVPFEISLPGLFNVYNLLAATSYLYHSDENYLNFIEDIKSFTPVFGRMETIEIGKNKYILSLIKNPTGFTESLRTVFSQSASCKTAIFILNDNYADGQDVSWIWDVNISKYISPQTQHFFISGTRSFDMALRIKYAGVSSEKIAIIPSLGGIFEKVNATQLGQLIPVFATYTATLDIQKYLEKTSVKNEYWRE